MDKQLLLLGLLLLIPLTTALEGYENPREGFITDTQVRVTDTAVYNTGYYSADGTDWQAFSLSGTTRGNWVVGEATADIDLSGIRYVAIYSCSWSSGWNCGSTWQVRDRGDPSLQSYLVQNGVPQADIVVASDAPSMVQLSAEYLQDYIQDMSGALLPIRNSPGDDYDFHVYIGESQYTQKLGIDASGTRDGGFKIISGENYLVLLGDDTPYDNNKYLSTQEWDAITAPDYFENPELDNRDYNSARRIWEMDAKGSMNAVHEFLRTQGMRWYHPNDFGVVTPQKQDIMFGQTNKLINPDSQMREIYFWYMRFGHLRDLDYQSDYEYGTGDEQMRYYLSLGINTLAEYIEGGFPHGLNAVTRREETVKNHPEYFAVWNGVRKDGSDGGEPKQNLCSEELKEATIRYVKKMHDVYDAQYVSIWPVDGFTRVSEHSQECLDKASPELGPGGGISNYVWDFTNDVAWAVHDDPNYTDKVMVLGGAYTSYTKPPSELSDSRGFAPNIAIWVVEQRRQFTDAEFTSQYRDMINEWMSILPSQQVFKYDHYLENSPGRGTGSTPVYFPHIIAEDIKFLGERSGGEFIETYSNPFRVTSHDSFAAISLNTYVTSRLLWDRNIDIDELLNEYYRLYYGPAANTMKELVEYSQDNFQIFSQSANPVLHMRELALQAREQVPAGSNYEKRIDNLLGLMNYNWDGEEKEISSCQELASPGTIYTLTQDVSGSASCFFINHNTITLDCKGHTITYSTAGGEDDHAVYIRAKKSVGHEATIQNCVIQDGSYNEGAQTGQAISSGHADFITIKNNSINTSGSAIGLSRSSNSTLQANTIYSQGIGINGFNGGSKGRTSISEHIYENNVVYSDTIGAYLYWSTNDIIRNNTFVGESGPGLQIRYPENLLLAYNHIQSTSGNALALLNNVINVQQEGNTIING